jgi:DNA-binding response OmpR family regulator
MSKEALLKGKRILIVDDEPDVLDTLEELLTMCDITKASSFDEARRLLENEKFEFAILDIMGVAGYDLLKIASNKNVTAVMLTAHALSPDNVVRSYKEGAAFYVPKEKMAEIETYLNDILDSLEKGKNTWSRWFERLGTYCEQRFGPEWQKDDKIFWEKFPFY